MSRAGAQATPGAARVAGARAVAPPRQPPSPGRPAGEQPRAGERARPTCSRGLFIGLLFFVVGPVIAAFTISFTAAGSALSAALGRVKARELADDRLFSRIALKTLYFAGVPVPVTLLLALRPLAGLMNRKLRGVEALRAIYFFPVTASIVAVSLLWA